MNIKLSGGSEARVSSLLVAKEFGREHRNVLTSLDGLVNKGRLGELDIKLTSYLDKSNRKSRSYELTERGFMIACPFIGGEKAREGQVAIVDELLRLRKLSESSEIEKRVWREVRLSTACEYFDLVRAVRAISTPENYVSLITRECNLINSVVLGQTAAEFKYENGVVSVRDSLTAEQLYLLDEVQSANIRLLLGGAPFEDRKKILAIMFPLEKSLALMPKSPVLGGVAW